jgi:hypothetical protein
MVFQPGPGALAVVAGEVIGDHVYGAVGVGLFLQLEEVLVEGRFVMLYRATTKTLELADLRRRVASDGVNAP